ncbi:DUF4369 domain-containing protein [Flavobacterium sp. GT3R68]|uniref:DUF4369 domain-containing protein n=1 Tax=Flavobacterium sp. GT3R68 TaxID=2594437 RepID=UPI000F8721AC|nr:DUF4369 domain-containing protein [Flavobacterium sp. GT3R68]RTY93363.1 DUF4369 domain-containing protein [Flavobacterium sp. GSN2]TRW92463.1 DUF4369 domain-containing protein [Flavobacterium sp. GT3R68]
MKNSIITLFSLILLVSCKEKETEKGLNITGNIKGLNKGTLYIKKLEDTTMVLLDSIKIDGNSAFESNIDLRSPEMLYLFVDRGATNTIDNTLMFFAEPGKMTINTELEYFYAKAVITGSKNQELYETFKKVNSRFSDQQLALTAQRLKAIRNNQTANLSGNETLSESNIKRKYLYAINFAVTNKDYEVAPYIALSEINDATLKYLDTIEKSMSPKVAKSKYGVMLTKYIAERKKTE